MIVVHHLNDSRSQRILWLLEELGVPYEVKRYERDPTTRFAPAELKAVHPLGKAPVIVDGDKTLHESGAIVDYLVRRYGDGRIAPSPTSEAYDEFVQWLHYAEGSAMTPFIRAPGGTMESVVMSPARPRSSTRAARTIGSTRSLGRGRISVTSVSLREGGCGDAGWRRLGVAGGRLMGMVAAPMGAPALLAGQRARRDQRRDEGGVAGLAQGRQFRHGGGEARLLAHHADLGLHQRTDRGEVGARSAGSGVGQHPTRRRRVEPVRDEPRIGQPFEERVTGEPVRPV